MGKGDIHTSFNPLLGVNFSNYCAAYSISVAEFEKIKLSLSGGCFT